jgi:hypothetical protein
MIASLNRVTVHRDTVRYAIPTLVVLTLAAALGLFVRRFLDQDESSYFVTVRFDADNAAMPILGHSGSSYEEQTGPGYYVPAAIVYRDAHPRGHLVAAPLVVGPLLNPATGSEYGVGLFAKLRLIVQMVRNTRAIPVLSHVFEHLTMAKTILNVPRETDGCVVERGTYAGGSRANLFLVCALVGRRLEVFDSFEGLPDRAAEEEVPRGRIFCGRGSTARFAGLEDVLCALPTL